MKSSREETVVFLKYVGRTRVPDGDREGAAGGAVDCDTTGDSEAVGIVA